MKKKNLNVLIIMIMLLGCILTGCTDRPPKEEGDKQALQMLEDLYGYVRLNGCVEGMLFIDEEFNLKEKSKWIERKKLKKAE